MQRSYTIGICGGSASGKTSFSKKLYAHLAPHANMISQDDYYFDRDISATSNMDHPDAIDFELIRKNVSCLKMFKSTSRPVYDFNTHKQTDRKVDVRPKPFLLVEGILIFQDVHLSNLLDLKIFIDCSSDIRLIRRILRDISERGRDLHSVLEQYEREVRPMHIKHVKPTMDKADIVVDGQTSFDEVINDKIVLYQPLVEFQKNLGLRP